MSHYWEKFKEYRLFSADKNFFQLGIFWFTFSIILLISITLVFGVTKTENYIGCMSATCFKTFIQSYKLPMGILSLLIPLGAIYAAQHRSEQTIAQIKSSESQNNFVNYYKHLEEFKEHLIDSDVLDNCVNYRDTHTRLFKDSRDGNYAIGTETQKVIRLQISNLYKGYRSLEKYSFAQLNSDETEAKNNLILKVTEIRDAISQLLNYFQLSKQHFSNEEQFKSKETQEILEDIVQTTSIYVGWLYLLTIFCPTYRQPVAINALSNIAFDSTDNLTPDSKLQFGLVDCGENGETIVIKAQSIPSSEKVSSQAT